LFVAGESFSAEHAAPDAQAPMQDAVMCFAARHGMVGARMSYRLAPANPWPSGARDVAAATSWLHQNIDVFGGNRDEIVAVGYSIGAFHVASLLAHPEFQITDSDVAAAVLVSGIYRERRRQLGGKILFRRGCEPIRPAIGVPRHLEHRDTVAARLVDARSPAHRRRGRNAETTPVQLRGPLSAHDPCVYRKPYSS
jgi:carboxylesterase type B